MINVKGKYLTRIFAASILGAAVCGCVTNNDHASGDDIERADVPAIAVNIVTDKIVANEINYNIYEMRSSDKFRYNIVHDLINKDMNNYYYPEEVCMEVGDVNNYIINKDFYGQYSKTGLNINEALIVSLSKYIDSSKMMGEVIDYISLSSNIVCLTFNDSGKYSGIAYGDFDVLILEIPSNSPVYESIKNDGSVEDVLINNRHSDEFNLMATIVTEEYVHGLQYMNYKLDDINNDDLGWDSYFELQIKAEAQAKIITAIVAIELLETQNGNYLYEYIARRGEMSSLIADIRVDMRKGHGYSRIISESINDYLDSCFLGHDSECISTLNYLFIIRDEYNRYSFGGNETVDETVIQELYNNVPTANIRSFNYTPTGVKIEYN